MHSPKVDLVALKAFGDEEIEREYIFRYQRVLQAAALQSASQTFFCSALGF